ncbi:MAG: hypothetical protein GY789_00925 [Hyphomicrobiales bacterium]|nr:hypothetical protein [Hyphomicrobiales bacterium]MCP4999391.1 hypothetical protein [Hyphomicrobiales bacterium]
MRTKPAVTILVTVLAISVAGCSIRNAVDTSWLRPQKDVPTVETVPVNPDDPGAPVEPVASDQPAIPPGQVTSSTPANPPVPAATASLPASSSQTTISFTPVIGAPIEAVRPLSRQLGSEARARGLVILQSGDGNSNHILKGYFSAFTDGDKTTVGFVWDVLDASGNRLHRIRGQEIAQGTATDPWDVVQASTMEAIAARTIADYMSWRSQAGG